MFKKITMNLIAMSMVGTVFGAVGYGVMYLIFSFTLMESDIGEMMNAACRMVGAIMFLIGFVLGGVAAVNDKTYEKKFGKGE